MSSFQNGRYFRIGAAVGRIYYWMAGSLVRDWPDTHCGAIFCSLGLPAAKPGQTLKACCTQAKTAIDGATVRVWPVPQVWDIATKVKLVKCNVRIITI